MFIVYDLYRQCTGFAAVLLEIFQVNSHCAYYCFIRCPLLQQTTTRHASTTRKRSNGQFAHKRYESLRASSSSELVS